MPTRGGRVAIYLIGPDQALLRMTETPYDSEALLQQ
jgi:hypothetical protein